MGCRCSVKRFLAENCVVVFPIRFGEAIPWCVAFSVHCAMELKVVIAFRVRVGEGHSFLHSPLDSVEGGGWTVEAHRQAGDTIAAPLGLDDVHLDPLDGLVVEVLRAPVLLLVRCVDEDHPIRILFDIP